MSVIRKKPFIEYLIDDLTAEQKQSLLDAVNGSGNTVDASISNMPASAITPVLFQFDANDSKTGILVQSTSYRVLICYHRFQDLLMFKFDAQNNYQKINEYLDINELRRLLEEVKDHIVASEIDSGEADAGLVLTADGEGGASWENISSIFTEDNVDEGDAVKLFGFDAQGNLVQDEMPEGIVVDDSLDTESNNAIANKPVAEAIEAIEADLETKANVDGNYPTMTVGVADQLSPYDDESGDDQDEPFSFQATGTGNGTQPDFATGAIALMKEKQGNTVVVNFKQSFGATKTVNGITFTNNNDGSITINGTSTDYADFVISVGDEFPANNHKLLAFTGSNDVIVNFSSLSGSALATVQTISVISQAYIRIEPNKTISNLTIRPIISDLTQWFNGDIPADLLAHPENFYRYYQGSLAYNEGTLVNANSRYLKAIGRNQWDEVAESGYIDPSTGQSASADGYLRSKNFNKCIGGLTYYLYGGNSINTECILWYDKDKNYIGYYSNPNHTTLAPSNACYFKIYFNSSTYNHDITISLYYEDESGYDQYYPYEVLTNNDTGTEELLAFDYKTPDGTIHKNTVEVDLSLLNWVYDDNNHQYYSGVNSNWKDGKVVCAHLFYNPLGYSEVSPTHTRGVIGGRIYIVSATEDSSLLTGIMQVQLTTPTTEQGTPYSENLVIDDFGTMDFSGTNGVPQGNLIFYPVDYKAFIDTLYDYTEGTPSNLALKSDLTPLNTVDTQLLNAIGGTLRNVLASSQSIDFNNTAFVDLGTLNWYYNATYGLYASVGATLKNAGKSLSTKYKTSVLAYDGLSNNELTTNNAGLGGNVIVVKDSSYTDATSFKNAMKGVLLAYEKAQ